MLKQLIGKRKTKYTKEDGLPVIYNYRKHANSQPKKLALLSYITLPFLAEKRGEVITRFSNSGLALCWAQTLNELGYAVDIIDWDNKKFAPRNKYDLVVLHGGKNFQNIYHRLESSPPLIHFLTGSYWKFNNREEDRRRTRFERRHGVIVPRDRYIYDTEDPVNDAADAIIVLGAPSMKESYPKYIKNKVITINNGSYPDRHFDEAKKDYTEARKNFLFFAGSGNIHKGLDLLIDAFKDLDQHLFIVTIPDKEVMDVYKQELKLPNIHLIGHIDMRSSKFYEFMNKCAFVILPSCSEGQAGSVVECMNQGLIPIISKETRLDARGYGMILKNNRITEIKRAVKKMANKETREIEKLSNRTRQTAIHRHSPEYFRKNLKKAVQEVVSLR